MSTPSVPAETAWTEQREQAIRERLAKATPGPWLQTHDLAYGVRIWPSEHGTPPLFQVLGGVHYSRVTDADPVPQWKKDADFVRCARSDLSAALDEIGRLRAENERLRNEFECQAAIASAALKSWESVRSQLAATREGETPRLVGDPLHPKIDGAVVTPVHGAECPTVRQRDRECTCGGMQAAARAAHYKGYPEPRSTTSPEMTPRDDTKG